MVINVYCSPLTLLLFVTTTSVSENIVCCTIEIYIQNRIPSYHLLFYYPDSSFSHLLLTFAIGSGSKLGFLLQPTATHPVRAFHNKSQMMPFLYFKTSISFKIPKVILHEASGDLLPPPISNSSKSLPQDLCTCLYCYVERMLT